MIFKPRMRSNQAGGRRHGGIIEYAVDHRKEEHHFVARADIHQHDKRKRADKINGAEEERTVDPVGEIAGEEHGSEIDRGSEAIDAGSRYGRKAAETA